MSWVHQRGYPGGPMVAVLGFPRPLYPPDAAPAHQPSVDGSDVEAYKRTVSRAGRWQWQAFDQAYSNDFAHGRAGGNVGESGIAGVQRQQGMQATGYVDSDTFNLLRSIRIPQGLPHAGEAAMDARAVELVNAAWERFAGKEPPPAGGSAAKARLEEAQRHVGVSEQPPYSNVCAPFTPWYPMQGPWCAVFVAYCDQNGAQPTQSFVRGSRYAYVPYIVDDARRGLNGLTVTSSPQPGDLVCFDWGRDGEYDHIGIVETPPDSGGGFQTVEGNTSLEGTRGSQSNGGRVCRRTRNRNRQGTVFVRVDEP